MATLLKSSVRRRVRRWLGTLFREARRLERRRRLRYASGIVLACGIASGGGFLIANHGESSTGPGDHPALPLVSSLALPKAGDYFALATVGDHIILSGGPDGSLFPSGSTTLLSDGRVVGTCDAATVEPGTLKLGHVAHANCGDPALYGEQVLAVSYLVHPVSGTRGVGEFAVRIAHVDPGALDGYTLGPVVMTYPQCSDCSAQWIYGDGSVWLYDSFDGANTTATHGELLRISSTGGVAQRWAISGMTRALLAVNSEGVWLAPSIESGGPLHASRSQIARYQSLYRITPRARAPVPVFNTGGAARWLVAAGDTVWLETGYANHGPNPYKLWRLQGENARPTLLGHYPANADESADIGESPPTHAGNSTIGIYYVTSAAYESSLNEPQQIIRLSPDTATQHTFASVPAAPDGDSYGEGPPGVALGRSFYFLDPPLLDYPGGNRAPIVEGRAVLYRATPNERRRDRVTARRG
jgi:hypothetical protein